MTLDIDEAFAALGELREKRPLVHNITNFVAMTVSANALLALGASPAMVHAEEEASDFAGIADALVVNIGTLSPSWVTAMERAATVMRAAEKPWVLDPVATGATPFRTEAARQLLRLRPTVVRGNASEIIALAEGSGAGKGVDSTAGSKAALAAAKALAKKEDMVVAVTGETDYATDGRRVFAVRGGHEMMPASTGLGCALSATIAAFATVRPPLHAAVAGLAIYGAAGSVAGERCPRGPGHLPAELCDALWNMNASALAAHADIREESA
ncbi:hydroxyethylthiazole kinase [Afifella pfennigii]|uniref:hydroxyethylthiazole kinase n=1 Tax=Afifella pfennigii TaxID=209897 RepID=UPI00047DF169|nr:hydroxyethylthiazole kinase [Afifella pfennigii]